MILIVHGGAGPRKPSRASQRSIDDALTAGYEVLKKEGSALDTVVQAIRIMEDSGRFNAGVGSVLQMDGVRRLDASLMEGAALRTGSVIGLEGIRNPIEAARRVMNTPHVMFTNLGAQRIAKGLPRLPRPNKKAFARLARVKNTEKGLIDLFETYYSTVGAVALDRHGNLAAGTSTGGTWAMLPGRVGDSPVIGAGTYAENSSGAVSCTGTGEHIIRLALAKEICMNMQLLPPSRTARQSLQRLIQIGGAGGVIVLNKNGRFSIQHTTDYMASGYRNEKGTVVQEGFDRAR
jgi:beta-aspartyl-peptidase (threonine type)